MYSIYQIYHHDVHTTLYYTYSVCHVQMAQGKIFNLFLLPRGTHTHTHYVDLDIKYVEYSFNKQV